MAAGSPVPDGWAVAVAIHPSGHLPDHPLTRTATVRSSDPRSLGPSSPILTISPNDAMLVPGWTSHYHAQGADALRMILQVMSAAGKDGVRSILDLPCGHGRVLRHIRARFPEARLTACDIDADGVEFCAKTFGATGIVSRKETSEVSIDDRFDLIWCGSLLTHLDRPAWQAWLEFFSDHLLDGGVLIFTTHGRYSAKRLAEQPRSPWFYPGLDDAEVPLMLRRYSATGFAFAPTPGTPDYGISVSSPAWVVAEVSGHPHLKLLSFVEMGWVEHQDVVACLRQEDIFLASWDRRPEP